MSSPATTGTKDNPAGSTRQNGTFEAGILSLAGPLMGGGVCPDLFRQLNRKDRAQVFGRAQQKQFAQGSKLFRQGDKHTGIFYIEEGHVRTYYMSPEGREITLARWRDGNIVGTPDVFGEGDHMWSGIAIEDTTSLYFSGDVVRKLVKRYPDFAMGLIENLSFKGRCMSSLVQLLGTRTVNGRLIKVLLALCSIYGVPTKDGIVIATRVTHDDLACMVGATRVWVTTTLRRMQRAGVLSVEARTIKILQADKLQAAQGDISGRSDLLARRFLTSSEVLYCEQ